MRKIFLSALFGPLFFFTAALFPQEILCRTKKAPPLLANLYWSAQMEAPKNGDGKILEDSSWIFCHGFKLNFGALEARLFNSCPKTGGADFWALDGFEAYEKIFDRRRWSLSLDLSNFSEEIRGKVIFGSIKFSSKKRGGPFFAAASPFVSSLGDSGIFSAALPSKSSSSQPDSLFANAAFKGVEKISSDKIRLMPVLAAFGLSKSESKNGKAPFFFDLSGGFFYLNFFKMTGGFFISNYCNEEKLSAALDWIEEVPQCKSELLNAFCADFSVEIPFLKSRTTFGFAQSPESLGRPVFAQEFLFASGIFSLAAAFFASDNLFMEEKSPYMAPTGRESKKNWQAKISPQFSFRLKNGRKAKIGAGFFIEEQIKDYGKKTCHNSLECKAAAAFQIYSKVNSFKLAGASGAAIMRQEPLQETVTPLPKASVSALYSHRFPKNGGRLSLSAGASFQPEYYWEKREWTERLKVVWNPRKSILSAASIAFEGSQKNGAFNISSMASASFAAKVKNIRVNASLSARLPFSF